MDLTIHDIIQGAVVSSKAHKLNAQQNKLFLQVHPKANKSQIKEAVKKLFNVEVVKVNTKIRKGKSRRINRTRTIKGALKKQAIVTLAEGYSLNLFGQGSDSMPSGEQG